MKMAPPSERSGSCASTSLSRTFPARSRVRPANACVLIVVMVGSPLTSANSASPVQRPAVAVSSAIAKNGVSETRLASRAVKASAASSGSFPFARCKGLARIKEMPLPEISSCSTSRPSAALRACALTVHEEVVFRGIVLENFDRSVQVAFTSVWTAQVPASGAVCALMRPATWQSGRLELRIPKRVGSRSRIASKLRVPWSAVPVNLSAGRRVASST